LCCDERVDRIRRHRRKGALAAFRYSVFYKLLYAFGLRNREGCRIDLYDFLPNPDHRSYGKFGALHVRWGKSSKGGPPRRRLVFLVPEVDWIVDVLKQYLADVRPLYDPGKLSSLFLTEQHHRLQVKRVDEDFKEVLSEAGLPAELTPHSLRHTYATNLAEWDYDPMFIQQQLGHSYASTTAIYTHLGSDYKRRAIRSALSRAYGDLSR
jgi:integrase/recombinase XerD